VVLLLVGVLFFGSCRELVACSSAVSQPCRSAAVPAAAKLMRIAVIEAAYVLHVHST
jgi:hypothetical protein